MCYTCHELDLEGPTENFVAKTGNDYFARCDEKDCWVCDTFKWSHKFTRPLKHSKKDLLNRARGRYGKKNKQGATEELERRRARFAKRDQDDEEE